MLTPEEVDTVKQLAKDRGMSMSGMAAELIRQALKLPENQRRQTGGNENAYEERMKKLIQIIRDNNLL